jgi:selenocysteine lyase/cysteine desulfurase
LGVVPFTVKGLSHFLVAAILGAEFGIGVRNGCFCAHPYLLHLLGLSPDEADAVRQRMMEHDRSDMPGLVRASFGMYNTAEEVDVLIDAVQRIARGKYYGRYQQDTATGEYRVVNWNPDLSHYFRL